MILVLLIIALAVGTDQLTKYIMAGLLPELEGQSLPVIPGVLHFTYVENTGAAFGMLAEHRWVFMILSVVGLALIALLLLKEKPKSAWVRLAAGLVLGGGIGNMIDRMGFGFAEREGAVLDFIDCRFIHFYVFNVADACVTVGCFLYLILIVVGEIRAAKEKAAAAEGPGAPSEEIAENAESAESAQVPENTESMEEPDDAQAPENAEDLSPAEAPEAGAEADAKQPGSEGPEGGDA